MKTSNLVMTSIGAIAGVVPAMAQESKKSTTEQYERPNIVYIMSDDHSMQTISAYGYGLNQTPNIDAIARSGLLLRQNFVSNSISGPCRAVVLTGKFSHMNGFRDNGPKAIFDGSQQTFPKLLQGAGYETAMVGKWHLGSMPTGFDYYCIHVGQGTYYSPEMIEPDGKKTYQGAYATDLTLEKSIEFLEGRDKSKPFCLMMHFKAPHRHWLPAPEKLQMYEDTTFRIPETFYDNYEGRIAAQQQMMSIAKDMTFEGDLKIMGIEIPNPQGGNIKPELERMTPEQRKAYKDTYEPIKADFLAQNLSGNALAEWKYQRYIRDYCKVISSVDDKVGEMVQYLKDNGLYDNTIIIYTSDQGFYMGEHGWFDKRFMYEESFHTPFLVSYPKEIKTPGKEITALTQNIDIAPTLLDYAGVKIPSDIQGESMRPLFNGKKNKIRKELYYHYYEYPLPHAVKRHLGIYDGRYKLIHFYFDIDEWELFDLKNDPNELHNLINDPAYKGVKNRMMKHLKALQKKYHDENGENDGYYDPREKTLNK